MQTFVKMPLKLLDGLLWFTHHFVSRRIFDHWGNLTLHVVKWIGQTLNLFNFGSRANYLQIHTSTHFFVSLSSSQQNISKQQTKLPVKMLNLPAAAHYHCEHDCVSNELKAPLHFTTASQRSWLLVFLNILCELFFPLSSMFHVKKKKKEKERINK